MIGLRLCGWLLPLGFLGSTAVGQFAEEAIERGIEYEMVGFPPPFGYSGFGCGFADLDQDGDQDLVILGSIDGTVGVFENDGEGYFTDRTPDTGIGHVPEPSAVAFADYDADGDLDLYVTQIDAPNRLLRNDGAFAFTDVTASAGVADAGVGQAATWGDLNGDGLPDLHVSNYTGGVNNNDGLDALYLNLGDGTFTDIAEAQGLAYDGYGFQTVWFDYDLDNDLDLYLSNDRGHLTGRKNQLWRNDAGVLVNVSDESGAGIGLVLDGRGLRRLRWERVP